MNMEVATLLHIYIVILLDIYIICTLRVFRIKLKNIRTDIGHIVDTKQWNENNNTRGNPNVRKNRFPLSR